MCLLFFSYTSGGMETEEEDERTCGIVYWCLGALLLFFGYQSCVTKPGIEKSLYCRLRANLVCVLLPFHTRVEIEAGGGDDWWCGVHWTGESCQGDEDDGTVSRREMRRR
jgi:hypothetical protein